jgi:hypothetical protein
MKIGDYVTIDEIKNQSVCRWIVLVDLEDDIYGGVEGGVIKYIENTKIKAGDKTAELNLSGIDAYLTCGALEPLSVGGVFVE